MTPEERAQIEEIRSRWFVDVEPPAPIATGDLVKPCKCGSRRYQDIAIHDGRSTRRECENGHFLCFVRWYEGEVVT